MSGGLNRDEWNEKLGLIGQSLARQGASAAISIIGSAPGILAGQPGSGTEPGRTSMDLDVWKPTSRYEFGSFKAAVEAAGLLYNPMGFEPERPYIQVVEPGIVQVGKFEPEMVDQYGGLTLTKAPIANLIASKLLRAEPPDLSDIAWMLGAYQPDPKEIKREVGRIVGSFPYEQRRVARENMIFLDALSPFAGTAEVPNAPEITASPQYASAEDQAGQLPVRVKGRGR